MRGDNEVQLKMRGFEGRAKRALNCLPAFHSGGSRSKEGLLHHRGDQIWMSLLPRIWTLLQADIAPHLAPYRDIRPARRHAQRRGYHHG
jgi:hypothetical protein